jgi:hypothetical protein
MYFLMEPNDPPGEFGVRLDLLNDDSDVSWMMGSRFPPDETPPVPLRLDFDPESAGTVLRDFYAVPVPLVSRRLLKILQESGVDNLDVYPAVITDPATGQVHDDHVAINIIGTVSAAHLTDSVFDARVPERRISAAIDRLVVDEEAARDTLFFRLAENVSAIVVHERVKERVERENFETVMFLSPDEWFSA